MAEREHELGCGDVQRELDLASLGPKHGQRTRVGHHHLAVELHRVHQPHVPHQLAPVEQLLDEGRQRLAREREGLHQSVALVAGLYGAVEPRRDVQPHLQAVGRVLLALEPGPVGDAQSHLRVGRRRFVGQQAVERDVQGLVEDVQLQPESGGLRLQRGAVGECQLARVDERLARVQRVAVRPAPRSCIACAVSVRV